MKDETILFETNVKPSFLLKNTRSNLEQKHCCSYSRGLIAGNVGILYTQGFISVFTYQRYMNLIDKAINGELKLRKKMQ